MSSQGSSLTIYFRERWTRFQKSVEHVEQTTRGSLDSLNSFTVMVSTSFPFKHRDLELPGPGARPSFMFIEYNQEPTESRNQPIRASHLGHVTDNQPIRDQFSLIRSVPDYNSGGGQSSSPITPSQNDEEYGFVEGRLLNQNVSEALHEMYRDAAPMRRSKRTTSDSHSYWTDTVGFNSAKNQLSCGSCWSFPTVRVGCQSL